ncbi:MAG: histidine kinase [Methyloprofundus sp.]|nr:histidine kinase [Methyloprofundus sp.]
MSLRHQISLRILLISLCILMLGGAIAIWQARNAVSNEVDSSIKLAQQLIKLSVGNTQFNEADWVYRLNSLEQTRHLNIQLRKPSGGLLNFNATALDVEQQELPPHWFIALVVSDYPKVEYPINTVDQQFLTLIIQANPMDEIIEVWHETLTFFKTILLLVFLTFIAVYFTFNQTLQAIQVIVENLKNIEQGQHPQKLPDFSTQEYNRIAQAINQMNDELSATQQQNQALTQHGFDIQEKERQRLSQELHDEFGQSLTAIKVMAVTAAYETSDTQAVTSAIVDICDHLMTVLRSMMKQLHPMILTELGFKASLEDLVHQWESRTPEIVFILQVDDWVDGMGETVVIQMFRVIQESLTNIIRHAEASEVSIRLTIEPNENMSILKLVIQDNGKGCDLDTISTGFGLQGMAERIKLLGGQFKMQSQEGVGMQIMAEIPV